MRSSILVLLMAAWFPAHGQDGSGLPRTSPSREGFRPTLTEELRAAAADALCWRRGWRSPWARSQARRAATAGRGRATRRC